MLGSLSSWSQQERIITGTVYDKSDKLPLPHVSIKILNTGLGAVSQSNGKFLYAVKSENIQKVQLEITYIGYKKQLITIGDRSYFDIYMESQGTDLEEVVITSSYGTKKLREEVVGSIVTVKSRDLQVTQAAESFDKMLEGIAPGVLVTGGSAPGDPVKINIRGQGSLTPLSNALLGTSTQPLVIIDGVVMSEETGFDNQQFDGAGILSEQFKNPLSKISPEDIEEINLLKDAAAVGIYGADAANGVILITTKKGKGAKPSFSFSTQVGFSSAINERRYLSGPQYHEILKEYYMSQGQSAQQASVNAGSSTINTDWLGLLNRDGVFKRYGFSGSTAIKNWSLRAALNVLDNEEGQISNNYKRIGGNLNLSYSSKKFNIGISLTPSTITQNAPNTLYNFPLPPNINAYDANGQFANIGNPGQGNPLAVAAQNKNFTKTNGIVSSINASYAINSNWKITTVFGADYVDKKQERFFSGANESGQLNGTFQVPDENGNLITYPRWGRKLEYSRNSFRWNQSTQLLYQKKWGKHTFDGLLGLELQKEKTDGKRTIGNGFINPDIDQSAQAASGAVSYSTSLNENSRRSVFGQLNYSYHSKYFALINLRQDESSAFGSNSNKNLNGGLGLSWNISSEDFLKDSKMIDFLRARISYGLTGNSRIGSYRSLGLYTISTNGNSGYNGNQIAYPSSSPNPNLTWEKNYKLNIGFDVNFLRKYKATIEYFRDNRKDMITSREIPLETGFSTIQINGADMYNSGIEFSIAANWFNNENFAWATNFNISTLESKVTALKGAGSDYSIAETARAQKVGYSTSAIWGVRSAGIDPATGREMFIKDGQLYDAATYNQLFTENDWEVIGDSQPDFFGGIQNTFTFFKKLSLGIRASFRYGDEVLIADELESQYRILVNRNVSVNVLDRWQQQGDIASSPRVSSTNPIVNNSSRFVYDASHIKIQNINLNYQLPLSPQNQKLITGASVFIDISNVAYFYKEKSLRGRNGIAEYRYEYPEARTITFGFKANF